ncbi:MAG: HEAT repeat domain-containing protein [Sandaracinus sp.]
MSAAIEAWIAALGDPARRLEAIAALGASGDRAASPHLVAALGSHRGEVRAAAARALASIADPATIEALSARSRADAFGVVALWSVLALARMDARAPVPTPAAAEPGTREGARYWAARLDVDRKRPELRALADETLEVLVSFGSEACEGLLDAALARSVADLSGLEASLARSLAARLATGSATELLRIVSFVLDRDQAWGHDVLTRAIDGDAEPSRREQLVSQIASYTREPGRTWARGLLERLAAGPEGAIARLAVRALSRRGLPAARTAPMITSGAPPPPALVPPLCTDALVPLARALARRLGHEGECEAPRTVSQTLPDPRPGWTRSRRTTTWTLGPVRLVHTEDAEEHPHEGGGCLDTATIELDRGRVISLGAGLASATIEGPDREETSALLDDTLDALGWVAPRWLAWAGGRVSLDPLAARVSFVQDDGGPGWSTELDASRGILQFRASRAEIVGGMLLVLTECEHANAGGGPSLFRLHRVREDGRVAWMRTLDLLERPHRVRLGARGLEVHAAWTTTLESTAPARWTPIDPETGSDRASTAAP